MARSVRDAKLDSRAAREKLAARGKPYFRTLDPGLHLGYRKLKGAPGRWVVRHYVGEQSYELRTIATADDLSTANGVDGLDFRQAQEAARTRRDGKQGSPVVGRAVMQFDGHDRIGGLKRFQVLFDKPVGATSEIAQTIRAGLVQ